LTRVNPRQPVSGKCCMDTEAVKLRRNAASGTDASFFLRNSYRSHRAHTTVQAI